MSTLAALLSQARPVRPVPLPGDGPTVHVRALTIAEMGRLDDRVKAIPDGPDRDTTAGLWLCVFSLCHADGTPLVPDPTDADVAFLAARPHWEVTAIAGPAGQINRTTKADAKN